MFDAVFPYGYTVYIFVCFTNRIGNFGINLALVLLTICFDMFGVANFLFFRNSEHYQKTARINNVVFHVVKNFLVFCASNLTVLYFFTGKSDSIGRLVIALFTECYLVIRGVWKAVRRKRAARETKSTQESQDGNP